MTKEQVPNEANELTDKLAKPLDDGVTMLHWHL